jgi:hypothetical protein
MRKLLAKTILVDDNDIRDEYNFRSGVRGKHYKTLQNEYTITIHKADGTTIVKGVTPKEGTVILDPDVKDYFPDSESVNAALRSLIKLIPTNRKNIEGKGRGSHERPRVHSGGHPKSARKKV